MTRDIAKPERAQVELERLRKLLGPVALSHGVELVDVEWTTGPAGRILRVTIDRPGQPGSAAAGARITLEDCVAVSRAASTVLDAEDVISLRYHLEVSSPGVDRPLRSAADFERHLGQLAKVRLQEPAGDGQKVLRGTITEASPAAIRMMVDGKDHVVTLSNVAEARPVLDFGGGKSKSRQKAHTKPAARPKRRQNDPGPNGTATASGPDGDRPQRPSKAKRS